MKVVPLTLLIIGLFLSQNIWANFHVSSPMADRSATKKQNTSLKVHNSQQAAQMVKNRYGGKLLKVCTQKCNWHACYKVKINKKNGHIISVLVDAQSGRLFGG